MIIEILHTVQVSVPRARAGARAVRAGGPDRGACGRILVITAEFGTLTDQGESAFRTP
jgi:hypothetical protein